MIAFRTGKWPRSLLRWWPYYRSSYLKLLTSVARLCSRPTSSSCAPHWSAKVSPNLDWAASRCWYLYRTISGTEQGWGIYCFGTISWLPLTHSSHCKYWRAVRSGMRLVIWSVPIKSISMTRKSLSEVSWAGRNRNRWLLFTHPAWWCSPLGVSFPTWFAAAKNVDYRQEGCPFRFQRHLRLQNGRWCITDELEARAHCWWLWPDFNLCRHGRTFKGTITALAWPDTVSQAPAQGITDIKALFLSDTTYS